MTEQASEDAAVVLVTGGAKRIGAAIVRVLHAAGMRVAVHCRRSVAPAEALCERLNAATAGSAHAFPADLVAIENVAPLIEAVVARFGRLDALVNNASSFYPSPVGTVTEAQWEDLLATNLKAPFFLAQRASPFLQRSSGSILNIADIYGRYPLREYPVYCAAKAGLIMLTRALALELAPAVRVNAIAPGAILWPEGGSEEGWRELLEATPARRSGEPEEIARAALYLLRDATFTTGEVLTVDGGRSIAR